MNTCCSECRIILGEDDRMSYITCVCGEVQYCSFECGKKNDHYSHHRKICQMKRFRDKYGGSLSVLLDSVPNEIFCGRCHHKSRKSDFEYFFNTVIIEFLPWETFRSFPLVSRRFSKTCLSEYMLKLWSRRKTSDNLITERIFEGCHRNWSDTLLFISNNGRSYIKASSDKEEVIKIEISPPTSETNWKIQMTQTLLGSKPRRVYHEVRNVITGNILSWKTPYEKPKNDNFWHDQGEDYSRKPESASLGALEVLILKKEVRTRSKYYRRGLQESSLGPTSQKIRENNVVKLKASKNVFIWDKEIELIKPSMGTRIPVVFQRSFDLK